MWLLIDAGNTRIKWAMVERAKYEPRSVAALTRLGQWHAYGASPHAQIGQLATHWRATPAHVAVHAVLISNVAGDAIRLALVAQLLQLQLQQAAAPLSIQWFGAAAQVAGLRNHYRDPTQLGCDRLATLIGASALFPAQALVVATCGTATTIDALTAEGDFIGGMILPGLAVMASALTQHTADLPLVDTLLQSQLEPQSLAGGTASWFADNTQAAIQNGCLAAQAGAIDHALAGHSAARCLISGGAAGWVAPRLRTPATRVGNLVLIGLQVVALSAL